MTDINNISDASIYEINFRFFYTIHSGNKQNFKKKIKKNPKKRLFEHKRDLIYNNLTNELDLYRNKFDLHCDLNLP